MSVYEDGSVMSERVPDAKARTLTCEYCSLRLQDKRCERVLVYGLVTLIILLLANILFLFVQYSGFRSLSSPVTNTSTPAFDAVEYVEADLYDMYSIGDEYLGPPTAEREQNWRDLWQHEVTMVPKWAMPILNRSHVELYEQVESQSNEGFSAMLKVYHQLGCLDIIRQYTWIQAGRYPPDLIPPEMQKSPGELRSNIDRCIDDLRVSLMCAADVTPILITKDRDSSSEYKAELNSHHKCRNFTKLQDWTRTHGIEHWENGGGFHEHGE
ncbi:conserved hypothetical protein [Talaromyces stipitatus ATCC 10500]|uniref:Tat pathway signal sequence n=1 Tax=Talaromyces stipitatus (strain ATCC 10500 / CBS 375.48 / QM 6759 / NRRL 1006) TaxID=441959 RepID=B8M8T4_TALSN|nr:uncharacterized protein TSTA_038080 [Talaromyces stipitatus ATCC 10500]EED20597.1 conserved hypothetical protein [Talaromyces stipitatus ATCC 10500]